MYATKSDDNNPSSHTDPEVNMIIIKCNFMTDIENIPEDRFMCSWWRCSWEDNISTWWRHQMETFSALLAICAGNSPVTGELAAQRPVTQSFDVFFDLRLNKRPSKQS